MPIQPQQQPQHVPTSQSQALASSTTYPTPRDGSALPQHWPQAYATVTGFPDRFHGWPQAALTNHGQAVVRHVAGHSSSGAGAGFNTTSVVTPFNEITNADMEQYILDDLEQELGQILGSDDTLPGRPERAAGTHVVAPRGKVADPALASYLATLEQQILAPDDVLPWLPEFDWEATDGITPQSMSGYVIAPDSTFSHESPAVQETPSSIAAGLTLPLQHPPEPDIEAALTLPRSSSVPTVHRQALGIPLSRTESVDNLVSEVLKFTRNNKIGKKSKRATTRFTKGLAELNAKPDKPEKIDVEPALAYFSDKAKPHVPYSDEMKARRSACKAKLAIERGWGNTALDYDHGTKVRLAIERGWGNTVADYDRAIRARAQEALANEGGSGA